MKTPLPTVKITIEIQSCSQCKFKGERHRVVGGWDRMIDWYCTKNDQTIQNAVEWHEEKNITIPTWCPQRA